MTTYTEKQLQILRAWPDTTVTDIVTLATDANMTAASVHGVVTSFIVRGLAQTTEVDGQVLQLTAKGAAAVRDAQADRPRTDGVRAEGKIAMIKLKAEEDEEKRQLYERRTTPKAKASKQQASMIDMLAAVRAHGGAHKNVKWVSILQRNDLIELIGNATTCNNAIYNVWVGAKTK